MKLEHGTKTKAVVMIGEISGDAEWRAADFIEHMTKPVVANRRGLVLALAGVVIAAAMFELGVRAGRDRMPEPATEESIDVGTPDLSFQADARGVHTSMQIIDVRSLRLSGALSIDLPVAAIDGDERRNGGLRITGRSRPYRRNDSAARGHRRPPR